MKLPQEFLDRMQQLMGDAEFKQFIESYECPRLYGLRVNILKVSVEDFLKISPFKLEPVPWTEDGFYYTEGENPGKHPYYHAGLYYIQEPSAMYPATLMDAKPGERVLDLCAAPGGKTVQLAAGMQGQGLLFANDVNRDRIKPLIRNIELAGIRNAVVLNETPARLAIKFDGYFDKILVDAPCSGEGMFRKDPEAIRSYEKFKSGRCADMQREMLGNADKMLKPGGRLVYSTCTFSPVENEKMISEFLDRHPAYEVADIPKAGGIGDGRPEWSDNESRLLKTARLWPHKLKGEGHFTAMLKKNGIDEIQTDSNFKVSDGKRTSISLKPFYDFLKENMNFDFEIEPFAIGSNLYHLPEPLPDVNSLNVEKFGWYLGKLCEDRFEPSHSMVISMKMHDFKNTVSFKSGSREILSYLKGETLMVGGTKSYTAVCVDGYTAGWAKQTGDMLKNLYPKGWRMMK